MAGAAAAAAAAPSSSLRSSQILWLLELPRVDQISGVTQQFAEEKVRLDFFHCGWLQGGEVVPHDGGPVVAETQVILPFACRVDAAEPCLGRVSGQRSSRAGGPRRILRRRGWRRRQWRVSWLFFCVDHCLARCCRLHVIVGSPLWERHAW